MAKQSKISHISDSDLRNMDVATIANQYYAGNKGAAWNIMFGPSGRFPGERSTVKPEKVPGEKKAASPVSATPAELFLPGRVQDYFYLVLGVPEETKITREMVEEAIEENSTKWSPVIRRLCPVNERPLLDAFIGHSGATLSERVSIAQETARMLPFKRAEATIAAAAAIDAKLTVQRERFESSRYDSDLTAFYAG